MGTLNGNALKKKEQKNKENNYPDKLKDIDSRILEINRNANRLVQSRRWQEMINSLFFAQIIKSLQIMIYLNHTFLSQYTLWVIML